MKPAPIALLALFVVAGSGCSIVVGSATRRVADNLSLAILDQNDPDTVRDGAPAYLLAVDGLIEGSPDNRGLLLAGAQLYSAYASAFVVEPDRAMLMTERARSYAHRALCEVRAELCAAVERPFDEFAPLLADVEPGHLPELYGFGAAWAGWVQARAGDWIAIAELPKIQAIMQRVVELDDTYDEGSAHLYLGVLATLRPATLGGEPEVGRQHFERAIEISEGRDLMAKVLFAENYAKLVFDRELHDRLLGEVVAADPVSRGRTLANTVAQEEARFLLEDADDYF